MRGSGTAPYSAARRCRLLCLPASHPARRSRAVLLTGSDARAGARLRARALGRRARRDRARRGRPAARRAAAAGRPGARAARRRRRRRRARGGERRRASSARSRSPDHAAVAVCGGFAIAGVVRQDLRAAVAALEGRCGLRASPPRRPSSGAAGRAGHLAAGRARARRRGADLRRPARFRRRNRPLQIGAEKRANCGLFRAIHGVEPKRRPDPLLASRHHDPYQGRRRSNDEVGFRRQSR